MTSSQRRCGPCYGGMQRMDMLVVAMETLGTVALERSLQSLQVTLPFRSDGMIWIDVLYPYLYFSCPANRILFRRFPGDTVFLGAEYIYILWSFTLCCLNTVNKLQAHQYYTRGTGLESPHSLLLPGLQMPPAIILEEM